VIHTLRYPPDFPILPRCCLAELTWVFGICSFQIQIGSVQIPTSTSGTIEVKTKDSNLSVLRPDCLCVTFFERYVRSILVRNPAQQDSKLTGLIGNPARVLNLRSLNKRGPLSKEIKNIKTANFK
jgi:hypothetical protein